MLLVACIAPRPHAWAATGDSTLRAERARVLLEAAEAWDAATRARAEVVAADAQLDRARHHLDAARERLGRIAVDLYVGSSRSTGLTVSTPAAVYLERAVPPELMAAGRAALGDVSAVLADAEATHRAAGAAAARADRSRDTAMAAEASVQASLAAVEALDGRIAQLDAAAAVGARARAAETAGFTPFPHQSTPAQQSLYRDRTASLLTLIDAAPLGPAPLPPPGWSPTDHHVAGLASWYGPGFVGRPTASGAVYDMEAPTVAHRWLPLGTFLWVTGPSGSALVVVTDRGPYVEGRVLDLSRAVAEWVGLAGLSSVTATVMAPPAGTPAFP